MLRIIVIFAVQAEFAPWRRMRRDFISPRKSDVPLYFTRFDRAEVTVLITGIGTRNGHAELRRILERHNACVVCGVAGSLKREHRVGKILVAKAVKRANTGSVMGSDEALVQIAADYGATPVDFFYTSDTVVTSAAEKSRLGEVADAVDMESFLVMAQAWRHGIPAVALRAVSDAVDRDVPFDFNRVIDEEGQIDWFPIVSQVAAMPWRLPPMLRFGFQSWRASRNLAHFLDRYLIRVADDAILYSDEWRWEVR